MRDGVVVRGNSGARWRRGRVRYAATIAIAVGTLLGGSLVASAARTPRGLLGTSSVPVGLAGHIISMSASGITGAGTTGTPGDIPVESFSWKFSAPIACHGCGRGAGRPSFNPFIIWRKVDRVSPILLRDCAQGKVIRTVTLYVTPTSTSSSDSLTMTLQNVTIIDDDWTVSTVGDEVPTETLTLNFRSYTIMYNAPTPSITTTTTSTTSTTTTTTTTTTTQPTVTYVPPPPTTTVLG